MEKDENELYQNIFESPYRPLGDMSEEEKDKELERWRNLWTWVESDVAWWITKLGSRVNFIRRDYKLLTGRLGQPHFILDSIDIDWVERDYNYSTGLATYETKTTTIKLSQLVDYEFIEKEEVVPENADGTPLEAEHQMADL